MLSQEALAEKIGLSRKQIVDYETGRIHLNDEMIIRFTRCLRDLSQLPENKKRAVLKILDDLIRANS